MKTSQLSFCTIVSILLLLVSLTLPGIVSASDKNAAPAENKNWYLMYVGTYTQDGSTSKGIYAYRYDAGSAKVTSIGLAAQTINPSFLAAHPNHRFLYAVNEVGDYKGQKSGAVSAFAIDSTTGKLTLLNQVASG
ncbi:MAG: beta-propeller fold lactonase family protein, partial [Candidatus Sulfotelmatobacter sp.]